MNRDERVEWYRRAREEPGYAVALALMEVAESIERLGLNGATAKDKPGPLEEIAILLKEHLTKEM